MEQQLVGGKKERGLDLGGTRPCGSESGGERQRGCWEREREVEVPWVEGGGGSKGNKELIERTVEKHGNEAGRYEGSEGERWMEALRTSSRSVVGKMVCNGEGAQIMFTQVGAALF